MNKYIIASIILIIVYAGGFFHGWKIKERTVETKIEIVEKTKIEWKERIVSREYNKLSYYECVNQLKGYDKDEPWLNGHIKGNTFKAAAGLCERSWTRDFKLDCKTQVGSNGNWKFYIGAGLGVAFILGYTIYRLNR